MTQEFVLSYRNAGGENQPVSVATPFPIQTVNKEDINVLIVAASAASHFFTASRACQVISVKEIHSVVGSTSAACQVRKCPSGTAPASGNSVLAAAIDLTATINSPVTPDLTATAADRLLVAGDSLAVSFAGTLTGLVGAVTVTVQYT